MSIVAQTPFGKPMREHFLFEDDFVNLNHGSFGTYPRSVRTALRKFQDESEAAPDKFMRYSCREYLLASRTAIGQLLRVPAETCVLVQNATLGVNIVLRNLVYEVGDVIIYFDTIYGACEKTIASILETNPLVQARKVSGYQFPCKHADVVDAFLQVAHDLQDSGLRAKVAVFDTICSLPGVRFPFERLTQECRRRGILSCVDGAHGVGQIPLDLASLDPDFLVSNCHKWLFTPRGSAVLYVPRRNQALIRTSYPTSHGYIARPHGSMPTASEIPNPLPTGEESADATEDFISLFKFVATTDNNPYYCVPAALEFRQRVCGGEAAIMQYIRDIAASGGDMVAHILGTEVMSSGREAPNASGSESNRSRQDSNVHSDDQNPYDEVRDCAFANVRLPVPSTSPALIAAIQDRLMTARPARPTGTHERDDEQTTFLAVYSYGAHLWARLSGQIYLDPEDFAWIGRKLQTVCAELSIQPYP